MRFHFHLVCYNGEYSSEDIKLSYEKTCRFAPEVLYYHSLQLFVICDLFSRVGKLAEKSIFECTLLERLLTKQNLINFL